MTNAETAKSKKSSDISRRIKEYLEISENQQNVELTEDWKNTVLESRAAAIAKSTEQEDIEEEQVRLLTVLMGNERYGIDVDLVSEIQPIEHISEVPCCPDFVVGVINIRGEIISVMDLKMIFKIELKGIADTPKVVVVKSSDMKFGILVDEILEIIDLPISEIQRPLATLSGIQQDYIRGQTKDLLALLNLQDFMKDSRFIINHEIE